MIPLFVLAELGDFDPSVHIRNYVSEFRLIPDQVNKIFISGMSRVEDNILYLGTFLRLQIFSREHFK